MQQQHQFKCDKCKATFANAVGLRSHQATHIASTIKYSSVDQQRRVYANTGQKTHPCDLCDATFTRPSVLRSHMRTRHTGERPYECDYCGKSYHSSDARRKHQRNHCYIKTPMTAQQCKDTFAQPSTVAGASDEAPFTCQPCRIHVKCEPNEEEGATLTDPSIKTGC